jgi:hypothetical protein
MPVGLFEQPLERLWSPRATDAVVAENPTCTSSFGTSAESIPAQSQEGLNIKHDISLPVSRYILEFVTATDASPKPLFPACGHLTFMTAPCTTT